MAPHHEVAAGGPARRLSGQGKTPQDGVRRDAGGPQHAVNPSVQVGVSAERLQRHAVVRPRRGTSGACVRAPTPQGGARPPTHHSNFTPTSGAVIVGGVEDGGVAARGDQLLTPSRHVSLHSSGRKTGAQVSVAGRLLLGTSAYPTSAPGYTHDSHPRCRGQHATPGNHHLSGLRGEMSPPQSANYIAEGVAATLPIAQGMQGPSPGPSHFPPPFTHQCVCCGATRHPTRPTSPGSPPHELVEENVDRLEKWFLEHFGRTVFAMGRTPLPEMTVPPHHVHLRPENRPPAVHVPASVPLHFFDEVRRQLDDEC
ncbi:hypothetical protein GWK47_044350 [Chionoecetes opilio]|uniref:Uncharacterized protein n=1 Tax=Chionoecetes opilio TaxID=41210 RepID=A0A8J4Y6S9_CHIOP|nr:hypothetical protein GWK47_044350 [Chionoecetes opilio]